MYYIYTITIDYKIVYIGMSRHPEKRLYEHYRDTCSILYKPLRLRFKNSGRVCSMNIIDSCNNRKDALIIERKHIIQYKSKRIFLWNDNDYFNGIITTECIINIKGLSNKLQAEINKIKEQLKDDKWIIT